MENSFFSFPSILIDIMLVLILLLLFFGILFGQRSLGYYQQLKGDESNLSLAVQRLKKENSLLQAKYFELKSLESN
ncbi:MAG: septum formation initiator [Epsilonproteobacteria bacterium]|jgi:cell division protein FtsB|nr:septum formation initiator [Campylobacterota bacterium]NPA88884.1 septum formation initiator [Campylobacterota bacterium]